MSIEKYLQKSVGVLLSIIIAGTPLFGQSLTVSAENPSQYMRSVETIALSMPGILQSHPEFRGKAVSVYEGKKELVHQSVDDDGDGETDEVLFQSSFLPKEKKQFTLRLSAKQSGPFAPRVDVRFVLPRQDLAWENDRIAFRIYGSVLAGDVRNGTDVWTKRVRYPIIEKWYRGEEEVPKRSYHQDHGEGADYFSVGKSLGCGSAGILWKGALIQPGLFSSYRIITNGPIRISFELYYSPVKVDTVNVFEVKRVTLDAGTNLNKIEERYITNVPVKGLGIAAGLVKRKNTTATQQQGEGWMSLWGATTADTAVGSLGTAVVIESGRVVSASEDTLHWLLSTPFNRSTLTYYAGAGWTLSGDFSSEKDWSGYVERFSELLKQPLIITVTKN